MQCPIFADIAIGTSGIFVSLVDETVRCVKRYHSLPGALMELRGQRLINDTSNLQHIVYDTDPGRIHFSFDLATRPTLSQLEDLGFSFQRLTAEGEKRRSGH
jgi:hypothetical protein